MQHCTTRLDGAASATASRSTRKGVSISDWKATVAENSEKYFYPRNEQSFSLSLLTVRPFSSQSKIMLMLSLKRSESALSRVKKRKHSFQLKAPVHLEF